MEDPDAAAPPVMLPVGELVPDAEEVPAEAVGTGKTAERTPEPGVDVLPDEGNGAFAHAVVDSACAAPRAIDEEVFAVAGSGEAEVSAVSAGETLVNAALVLFLLV